MTRTLTWQDNRRDAWKVQTTVTQNYKKSARQLTNREFRTFVSDVEQLGHPPGYPILIAVISRFSSDVDSGLQFVQIFADSAATVLLFLIALEFFSLPVAIVSGLLAAISRQFAYFTVLLLPDSLIVFPTLLAIYLLARYRRHSSLWYCVGAGALIGISCWLRANALLLPLFLAVATGWVTKRSNRYSGAFAVIVGAVIAIAPVTIKNAIVFHRFIPVSLGAGQTLLEGIADYDSSLGIPKTDSELIRQEAQTKGRPEYATGLFNIDGIERDRNRTARGLNIISSRPLWFGSVVARRAVASMRLDPVPVLSAESPASHANISSGKLIWRKAGADLLRSSQTSPNASVTTLDFESIKIIGDLNEYGTQLTTNPFHVETFHDYLLTMQVTPKTGRVMIRIESGAGKPIAIENIDLVEGLSAYEQPYQFLEIPFVSATNGNVQVVIANNAATKSGITIGNVQVFDLGPSSNIWLRYIRQPIRFMQRFFTTALFMPFVLIGIGLAVYLRKKNELVLLLVVPIYYLTVQSLLHTERRYVYVIHFFFTVFAGLALCWLGGLVFQQLRKLRKSTG